MSQAVETVPAPTFLNQLNSLWALYCLTLRQHFYGRRWMVMAFLCVVICGLALLIRFTAPNVPSIVLDFTLVFMLIPQALLPLLALLYASGIIQDEQEEQTLTYLLVRPIPKWSLYLVKLLATITTVVVLTVLLIGLIYLAIYTGGELSLAEVASRFAKTAGIHALTVSVYCCLFGLLSLMFRHSLLIGIVYIAVIEGLLANMPFSIRLVTVVYYSRLIAYRLLSFIVPSHRGIEANEDLADIAWQLDANQDPNMLAHPALTTCYKVLVIAGIVCAVFAAIKCARKEFHVKTPEKAN